MRFTLLFWSKINGEIKRWVGKSVKGKIMGGSIVEGGIAVSLAFTMEGRENSGSWWVGKARPIEAVRQIRLTLQMSCITILGNKIGEESGMGKP